MRSLANTMHGKCFSTLTTLARGLGTIIWMISTLLLCLPGLVPGALAQQVILVDDDGAQCPGAVTTIQQAVALASPGATILVCPGSYTRTVNIIGHDKDGLKLIAVGRRTNRSLHDEQRGADILATVGMNEEAAGPAGSEDRLESEEVVLLGDHTECDGFHLENVNGVLIRGFTVQDFGCRLTTLTQSGVGNNIMLTHADHNTIEHNSLTASDMMGIMVVDSADNVFQYNVTYAIDANGTGCGIHMQGRRSSNNLFRYNISYGNPWAGIMIRNAGTGNVIVDNNFNNNGRWGITHSGTSGTRIEGNRVNHNIGQWGVQAPQPGQPAGLGIDVRTSTGVVVRDNVAQNNSGLDFFWDGTGTNTITSNTCQTSTPGGLCSSGGGQ